MCELPAKIACRPTTFAIFTVEVRPPWKVLVAAPKPAQRRAIFLTEALAPAAFRRTGQARFECDVIPLDELGTKPLDDYAAVCLLDPPPLSDATLANARHLRRAWRRAGDLAGPKRTAQGLLGRRVQHAGSAETDAGQTGAAVASPRCVPGAARLSASAVGQVPQHRRQRSLGCVYRLVALEAGRLGRGREHRHPLQQRAAGAVGAQRRQRSRAGVHHADFRRSHRCRLVEPVGRRQPNRGRS